MSDDVEITGGSGKPIAVDEVTDLKATPRTRFYQRVKIVPGPNNVAQEDVSPRVPLPTHDDALTDILQDILLELRLITAVLMEEMPPKRFLVDETLPAGLMRSHFGGITQGEFENA